MLPIEVVENVLATALKNGGDLAEVYIENKETLNLSLDDGRVERASQGSDIGGGIRVFYGDSAAYAYTDDLTEEALTEAAKAAAAAAQGTNKNRVSINLSRSESDLDFPIKVPYNEMPVASKADILRHMDQAARETSPYIVQVQASLVQTSRRVWIYNSEGLWAEDDREILEFRGQVTAQRNDNRQTQTTGLGGQIGLELLDQKDPVSAIVDAAGRRAFS
jgi:TldD protein